VAATNRDEELYFSARTTTVQFQSLLVRLNTSQVVSEAGSLAARLSCRKARNASLEEIEPWVLNGWNTEHLLHLNSEHIPSDALGHALHWAFPQAYYGAYCLTLGYYKTVGFTESTHTAVLRRFAKDVRDGRYPENVSFFLDGGKTRQHVNLAPCKVPSNVAFDAGDPGNVDAHICGFLNATRHEDLKAHLRHMRLQTRSGTRRRSFRREHWQQASDGLGPTTLFDLLYRKRIKANYREIDTFLHPALDAAEVYRSLKQCVAVLNFIHESFIARALGIAVLDALIEKTGPGVQQRLQRRRARIAQLQ
jgi:hypothetical protein